MISLLLGVDTISSLFGDLEEENVESFIGYLEAVNCNEPLSTVAFSLGFAKPLSFRVKNHPLARLMFLAPLPFFFLQFMHCIG